MQDDNITLEWPEWSELVNARFLPLINNKSRYLLLYGGRGSSKSRFAATKLVYRCLNEEYFKCILIRRVADTIKESQYAEIKQVVSDLGLDDLFQFKVSPLEINCTNGNKFICRGMDDVAKLKSIKDPSAVWIEEDIPESEDAFQTITTSIRTLKASYLQEIFTFNPECEGNYSEHWFYRKFFEGQIEKSFNGSTTIALPQAGGHKKIITQEYTVHHSTYHDNRFIPDSFRGQMESLKQTNPYRYGVYCLGEWGNRDKGALFYKCFDSRFVVEDIRYNPNLPLHFSIDFNVNPFMSGLVFQLEGKQVRVIDELAIPSPSNTTKGLCREFMRRYPAHHAGLYIYGDATGRARDTRLEHGENDFTIIQNELRLYRPSLRVPTKNPYVVQRGQFINSIFSEGFNGIDVIISAKCSHLLQDFNFLKEDSDGTKKKERATKDSISFEKYGHHSDCFDYMLCEAFKGDLHNYTHGNLSPVRTFGNDTYNTKFRY